MAQAVRSALMNSDLPRSRFILSGEYYPVTRRQMKQSWRHLRRMVKEGPAEVLNVEETVKEVSRQGFLLEPVLEPHQTNRTELLLDKLPHLPCERICTRHRKLQHWQQPAMNPLSLFQ